MKGDLWGLFLFTDALGAAHEGLLRSHGLEDCAGHPCSLHAPSDHHMREWRLHWRGDRGLMERICPEHGVGHPDPDHLGYVGRTYGAVTRRTEAIHGCCPEGCCWPPEEDVA